jgi:dienelactone hydrolase
MILERGYAVATAHYGQIAPDDANLAFAHGVPTLFQTPAEKERSAHQWGTIGAWSWGLARMLDYLEQEPQIDASHAAVIGHSRLGKTALWAGATNPRFALVISNDSGCGGAALFRRRFGERIDHMAKNFPHWFCRTYSSYANREPELPIDQHMLIAAIAPRPVYVASATEDRWADPHGEFLAAKGAEPIYQLYGKPGLPAESWPAPDQPAHGTIGYHLRTGKHDVTAYDWQQYLDFADRHFQH